MLGLMFIAFIGTGAFGVHLAREQYKSLDDDTSVNFGFISICLGCLIAVSLAVNVKLFNTYGNDMIFFNLIIVMIKGMLAGGLLVTMILDNGKENKKEGIIESEKSIDEKSEDVSLSIIKKIQDEKDSK